MRHIDTYQIFEARGYMSELGQIADEIIGKLSKSDSFLHEGRTPRGSFLVEIQSIPEKEYRKKYTGKATCLLDFNKTFTKGGNPDRKIPTIVLIKGLETRSTLVHELKHAFSYTFGSPKQLRLDHIMNDLSHGIGDTYSDYFRISPEELSLIIYCLNREELEAWYNGYASDIANATVSENGKVRPMSTKEKEYLINTTYRKDMIFGLLKRYQDGGFDLSDFFRSPERMNMFFDNYYRNLHEKSKSPFWRAFDRIKILGSKFFGTKNDYSKIVKSINQEINNNCSKYFKKYMKIYSL
jgi:hypothetical protein